MFDISDNKSAILQMLNGEKGTVNSIKASPKNLELLGVFCEKNAAILKKLNDYPEILSLYEEIIDLQEQMEVCTQDEAYIQGFRFGVLLGMDILDDKL